MCDSYGISKQISMLWTDPLIVFWLLGSEQAYTRSLAWMVVTNGTDLLFRISHMTESKDRETCCKLCEGVIYTDAEALSKVEACELCKSCNHGKI